MRIDFIHKKHPDWYGSIVPCSRPGLDHPATLFAEPQRCAV